MIHDPGIFAMEWLDLGTAKIPKTIKSLFKLLRVATNTSSVLSTVVNMKAGYVITPIIYGSPTAELTDVSKAWKKTLEKTMKIYDVEKAMMVDALIYGNAFVMFQLPWQRVFRCRRCQHEFNDKAIPAKDWDFSWTTGNLGSSFTAVCPKCNTRGIVDVADKFLKNQPVNVRLHRISPENIHIEHNPITGHRQYFYKLNPNFRRRLAGGARRFLVETTPLGFLEALAPGKVVHLNSRTLYHLTAGDMAQYDPAWGLPPMLPVLRDAWLVQIYLKAQEAVAKDHIVPLTVLSPSQAGGSAAPHMSRDLGRWRTEIETALRAHNTDKNRVLFMPEPVNIDYIRGDANALSVHDDLAELRRGIFAALGIPAEMLFGSVSWSAGHVGLRIAENSMLPLVQNLQRFLSEWLIPLIIQQCGLGDIEIKHQKFKMADDTQQRELTLRMQNVGLVSAQTARSELGFDHGQENKRIMDELDRRIIMDRIMQTESAKTEADTIAIRITAEVKAQAKAQLEAQQEMQQDSIKSAVEQLMAQGLSKEEAEHMIQQQLTEQGSEGERKEGSDTLRVSGADTQRVSGADTRSVTAGADTPKVGSVDARRAAVGDGAKLLKFSLLNKDIATNKANMLRLTHTDEEIKAMMPALKKDWPLVATEMTTLLTSSVSTPDISKQRQGHTGGTGYRSPK